MALLHAAVEARRGASHFPPLHVATVDHAIRPESADEARFVADACNRLNVPHRTLRLDWEPPATGLQAKARRERLGALREMALGIEAAILTGHTADDDAETMAMRAERDGSGDAEWAGIPVGLWLQPGWLLRPLLRRRRSALREWLEARDTSWIEDPSNEDERFERVRVRRSLASDPSGAERLIGRANAAGRDREALAGEAARVLSVEFRATCEGFAARATRSDRLAPDDPAAMLALRTVCAHVGGLTRMPPPAATKDALGKLRTPGPAGKARRATLSRCVLAPREGGLDILPEDRDAGAPRVSGYAVAFGRANGEWREPRRVAADVWGVPLFHGVWTPDRLGPDEPVWAPNPAIYSTNPNATLPPTAAIMHVTSPHGMIHAHVGGGSERRVSTRPLVRALTPYVEFVPSHDLPLAKALAHLAGRMSGAVPRHLPTDAEGRVFEPR